MDPATPRPAPDGAQPGAPLPTGGGGFPPAPRTDGTNAPAADPPVPDATAPPRPAADDPWSRSTPLGAPTDARPPRLPPEVVAPTAAAADAGHRADQDIHDISPTDADRPSLPTGEPNRAFDARQVQDVDEAAPLPAVPDRGYGTVGTGSTAPAGDGPAASAAAAMTSAPRERPESGTVSPSGDAGEGIPPWPTREDLRDDAGRIPGAVEPPKGLRDQLGRTRSAAARLIGAHVELARGELADILEEVKRAAVLAGLAVGALVLTGFLLVVGLSLFVGETVFGSIGWGVLHGTLLLLGVALAAVLVALGAGGAGRAFFAGLVVAVGVGILLGLDLPNRAWSTLGAQVAGNIAADIRPLVVGAGTLAILGAVGGLLLGAASAGGAGALVGLIVGGLLGAFVGALTSIALGPRVGAAVGVTTGLLAWITLMAPRLAEIDGERLKERFWPRSTIETTKETIEWVRERTPRGPKS